MGSERRQAKKGGDLFHYGFFPSPKLQFYYFSLFKYYFNNKINQSGPKGLVPTQIRLTHGSTQAVGPNGPSSIQVFIFTTQSF